MVPLSVRNTEYANSTESGYTSPSGPVPRRPLIKAALYVRVSTLDDQSTDIQIQELTSCCRRQGWEIGDSYQDMLFGARAKRPGLDRLMADARLRRFDCLLAWKLDRSGRSLVDCLNNLQTLEAAVVRFIVVGQGLDTDHCNLVARFMLQALGAAAEFERSLTVEMSLAG